MSSEPVVHVAMPSLMSLLIELRAKGSPLASGTAFMWKRDDGEAALVTARHNFTGQHSVTGGFLSATCAVPDEVLVWHPSEQLNRWVGLNYALRGADDQPLWDEHPVHGSRVDVAAMRVTLPPTAVTRPYSLGKSADIALGPADVVSVVGFPFGIASDGRLAIWMTGFIASDPDVDFNRLPQFLIDCRSRPGQSGSAVIAYRGGGAVKMSNGTLVHSPGPMWRFAGLYSGRIDERSDLGMVWKPSVVAEVANAARPPQPWTPLLAARPSATESAP